MRAPTYCNAVTVRELGDAAVQVDLAYDPFGAGEPGAAEIASVVLSDATACELVRQLAVRGIRA